MGNSLLLPCVCHCCHGVVNEVGAGAKIRKRIRKQRRPADSSSGRSVVRAARPRHVVPVVDAPEDGDDGGWEWEREAWPECRVEAPAAAGHGEDGGVRRVRIVMKRKDIAQLVARLEQRGAGVEDVGSSIELDGGGVTMSPCRGAWSPRLSIIPENY